MDLVRRFGDSPLDGFFVGVTEDRWHDGPRGASSRSTGNGIREYVAPLMFLKELLDNALHESVKLLQAEV